MVLCSATDIHVDTGRPPSRGEHEGLRMLGPKVCSFTREVVARLVVSNVQLACRQPWKPAAVRCASLRAISHAIRVDCFMELGVL
jgi:hypothetical protein